MLGRETFPVLILAIILRTVKMSKHHYSCHRHRSSLPFILLCRLGRDSVLFFVAIVSTIRRHSFIMSVFVFEWADYLFLFLLFDAYSYLEETMMTRLMIKRRDGSDRSVVSWYVCIV